MAKQKETLEEGLNRAANKKGLTGKARKRYIGGTLENLSKKGKITLKKAPPPRKIKKPIEKIHLVAKKNGPASKARGYDVYSIYKEGNTTPYTDSTYRKRAVAVRAAQDEQDAHNQGLVQKRIK